MPLFHHFDVNDNLIILFSGVSCILSRVTRALAKTEDAFFASTACGLLLYIFQAPIRAQMTRCVSSLELGKVFAMLASLESVVPIASSALFTWLYNSTSELFYPWQGSFYFLSAGFTVLGQEFGPLENILIIIHTGMLIALAVYISLGFKQIESEEDLQEEKPSQDLTTDYIISNISDLTHL